jgi:hypothetical protein
MDNIIIVLGWVYICRILPADDVMQENKKATINAKKVQNGQYPDFACSHEPYYYLDLHELNFPDRDERGCGLVNMTVHALVRNLNYR